MTGTLVFLSAGVVVITIWTPLASGSPGNALWHEITKHLPVFKTEEYLMVVAGRGGDTHSIVYFISPLLKNTNGIIRRYFAV